MTFLTSRQFLNCGLVLIALIQLASSLKCYTCGIYIPKDEYNKPNTLFPCKSFNETDLKECRASEKACMTYKIKDFIVLSCSSNCNEEVNSYGEREIHCCRSDGCNQDQTAVVAQLFSSSNPKVESIKLITIMSIISWLSMSLI